MSTQAVGLPPPAPRISAHVRFVARRVALVLGAIVAVGAGLRFGSLGVQSYHHDEVITAMRVIPGSFGEMLHKVRVSESNPPLYYVLAWGWAKTFGFEEFGLRSLSALFGTATIPVGYLIGSQLDRRRTGLILAGLLALDPMLIWYSQEARSYALLIFFGALSLYYFLRARQSGSGRDLGLWALFSALALASHYFAFFQVAIEGGWLLWLQRRHLRVVLPALAVVGATGLALLPLLLAQINPRHINWIEEGSLAARLWEAGVASLAGETGPVIGEPLRPHYALIPAIAVAISLVLLVRRGSRGQRRSAAIALVIGLGVVACAVLAAAVGKDYVIARNLLPALVPLLAVVALGLAAAPRRLALGLLAVLCAYWLVFAVYLTQTPNLQRPDFRVVGQELGAPQAHRAIVSWRLAADPIRWYLPGKTLEALSGSWPVRELDLVAKAVLGGSERASAASVLPGFAVKETIPAGRLTITRFLAPRPVRLTVAQMKELPTGFRDNGVVVDRPPAGASVGVSKAEVAQ